MDPQKIRRGRPLAVTMLALAVSALGAAQASAHAIVSPAVAKANALQLYTLSVPTEKDGATTTKIELDLPAGFAIDSFEAEPGWKRSVVSTGSREGALVQKVVWTGGHTPTDEDSVFAFNASATKARTYSFKVQQTYSDGSVVDWTGPESSETPAPTIQALSSFSSGSSSTLGVIALIVAALALVLGVIGLAGGRRSLT